MAFIVWIVVLVANWKIFKKMGREGWEGIVPFYNSYVLFEIIEGSGWKMLWLFVPFANIYWIFKLNIDMAKEFNLGTGFGIGLTLLAPVFNMILAFGDYSFRGISYDE